ncbi:MAG: hypothetical protein GEV07_03000 [Streptosporangiales bacterium]|nr:hypothetical protein [Streptosporangiales bacterium]
MNGRWFGRRVLAGAAVLALAGPAAACAQEEDEPVELPSLTGSETVNRTPSATSAPSETASGDYSDQAMGAEDAVREVYKALIDVSHRAQRKPPAEQREYLGGWTTGAELRARLQALRTNHREHERLVGHEESNVMRVDIYADGKTASVDDCLDLSKSYSVDARTGREIAGSRGTEDFWGIAFLRKTDAGWRVYDTFYQPEKCTVGSTPARPASPPRTPTSSSTATPTD